ncbi:hypothetical protein [Nitrosomonas supralitoralis]|uniref:Restriction endonuclease n=1 Tax=Nitrosomonas supralitoralis TaxID=2116706 RepID=A0A2P7NVJ6_9PROT|nr:hypothetical protein [Nitrosomonas supralitoralis]PSJ17497.1 hypothetical protein C7H79_07885 [Nitrosomonas supralitoralis]
MSINWAERERDTNRLVRVVARHVFNTNSTSPENVFGLAKLAWITNSYEGDNPAYIESTKIPALGNALSINFAGHSLDEVAQQCVAITGSTEIGGLVRRHTGFTNFYGAYRNSVRGWIEEHHKELEQLFFAAFQATSIGDRRKLIARLECLPGIPKANHPEQLMKAEYFVTPALFSLDPDVCFPLINGNEWVQNVLVSLNVVGSSLSNQFAAMSGMIGESGISDAADLDQVGRAMGRDAVDFVRTSTRAPTKRLLARKDTKTVTQLSLKDESDVDVISRSGKRVHRRLHNQLTNAFLDVMEDYLLIEGDSEDCMFDVLVKNYDGEKNDLLVETKSTTNSANIRMAVGQLYHYWYVIGGDVDEAHLAILLPSMPESRDRLFLSAMGIGVLWFECGKLVTSDDWLAHLANES